MKLLTQYLHLTDDLLKFRGISVTIFKREGAECLPFSIFSIHWFMDLFAVLWHLDTREAIGWMNLELCPVLVNLREDSVSSAGENSKTILYGKEWTCEKRVLNQQVHGVSYINSLALYLVLTIFTRLRGLPGKYFFHQGYLRKEYVCSSWSLPLRNFF